MNRDHKRAVASLLRASSILISTIAIANAATFYVTVAGLGGEADYEQPDGERQPPEPVAS